LQIIGLAMRDAAEPEPRSLKGLPVLEELAKFVALSASSA
jgi:hypothetical protein